MTERTYTGQQEVEEEERNRRIDDALLVYHIECAMWYFTSGPFPTLSEQDFQ